MEKPEQQFRKYLASQKLKYTPERRKIFGEILSAKNHFDADELFVRVNDNNTKRVSRATVYRTLDLLVKLGIIRKICLGDTSSLYENIVDVKKHGHLVCLSCRKIIKFELGKIESILGEACNDNQFSPQNRCIQVSGYCEDCLEKSALRITR
jgi:Fur family ferric uptake transcriptional regulator